MSSLFLVFINSEQFGFRVSPLCCKPDFEQLITPFPRWWAFYFRLTFFARRPPHLKAWHRLIIPQSLPCTEAFYHLHRRWVSADVRSHCQYSSSQIEVHSLTLLDLSPWRQHPNNNMIQTSELREFTKLIIIMANHWIEYLYFHTSFEDWLFNCSSYKNKNIERKCHFDKKYIQMQSVIGWVGQSQELKIQGLHSNAEERIAYLKAAPL